MRNIKSNNMNETVMSMERSKIEEEFESIQMTTDLSVSKERLDKIRSATQNDDDLTILKRIIEQGWPAQRADVPNRIKGYFSIRDELTTQDGIVFKGDRVVIPYELRTDILNRLHMGHIGIQSCQRRAKETVYWPKISVDIENFVKKCETCQEYQPEQQKEPMKPHEIPSRPWERIAVDLFEFHNKNYLITVDYFSNYFEVDRLYGTSAKTVIKNLKAHFARHGIPDVLVSDNGPQFVAKEFKNFEETYEFKHATSSPGYAQSNGKAENSVKTAKRLLRKCVRDGTDPFLALLSWRNTRSENMESSPVQRLFGRRTKTLLPTVTSLLKPKICDNVKSELHAKKMKQKRYYDRGAKAMKELSTGDIVRIRPNKPNKEWKKGRIEEQVNIRSYNVKTEDGASYRRNRRHLREMKESDIKIDESDYTQSNETNDNQSLPSNKVTTAETEQTLEIPPLRRSARERKAPEYLKDYVTR